MYDRNPEWKNHSGFFAFPDPCHIQDPTIICDYETKKGEDFMQHFNDGLLRVAAYIRVSTESSQQEESYETQKNYFMELLESNPSWISAGIYSDYGISGTSRERRTGFRRLLRHCEEGRIDRILAKSISRFARNTGDFLKVLEILKKNHVTIVFEKEHLDTAVAQSDLLLTAFGAAAQEESRNISANIRWGIQKHYPKGETRNIPIYGYRYAEGENSYQVMESGYSFRKIEIVEEQAMVVRRIFREVAEGKSYISIARELNYENIPIPETAAVNKRRDTAETPKGVLNRELEEGWTAGHISRMIRLERYAGDVLLQKTYKPDYKSHRVVKNRGELEQFYIKNHHPEIISRELFGEVRSVRRMKSMQFSTKGIRRSYPFTGRLICKHCGRFYWTRNRSSHPIWYCSSTAQNNGKRICTAERIFEEQLIRMCRKAFISRFHIISDILKDAAGQPNIFSGSYMAADISFHEENDNLIANLIRKMEMLQSADEMEHDQIILKNQIAKKMDEIDRETQATETVKARIESIRIRQKVLHEEIDPSEFCSLKSCLAETEKNLKENLRIMRDFVEHLDSMEKYWAALEKDYEWRKRAIAWMKTLPKGQQGVIDFLNGLTDEHIKAFILFIEVESPVKYRVRWFDDTWSDVEMFSNAETWG